MRPSIIMAFAWMLTILATVALFLALNNWRNPQPDNDSIPQPPPGYEYCVDGENLSFCRVHP